MTLLTCIVAAEDDERLDLAHSPQPLNEWSGLQVIDLDTAKVVMLHCLLTGDEFDLALAQYEPVHGPDEAGPLLLRLADEAMARLNLLDEEALAEIAMELAASEVFEEAGWDEGQACELLLDLANLAQLAESQGQALYIWMRPEGERRVDE